MTRRKIYLATPRGADDDICYLPSARRAALASRSRWDVNAALQMRFPRLAISQPLLPPFSLRVIALLR